MQTSDKDELVEETVDQVSALYVRHDQRTTPVQRVANRITAALARPASLVVILGLAVFWMAGNYFARAMGSHALEQFPFPDLGFVATITALLVALLILTTQRHEGELAERRAQLTLHLAALSERKIAKVIALLEEQRRDNPLLPHRVDPEAAGMAQPTDAHTALDRLDDAAGGH